MANTDKMICSRCKVEMNHHCDKIVYNVDAHDAGKTDPVTGRASFGNGMKTRTQSRICRRSLLCFMHTCRFWHH